MIILIAFVFVFISLYHCVVTTPKLLVFMKSANLNKASIDFSAPSFVASSYQTPKSPSSLLLGRAKEEELMLLYKDPYNYSKNRKGRVLFWINNITILVK